MSAAKSASHTALSSPAATTGAAPPGEAAGASRFSAASAWLIAVPLAISAFNRRRKPTSSSEYSR